MSIWTERARGILLAVIAWPILLALVWFILIFVAVVGFPDNEYLDTSPD
jgi:hypothetical protein